MRFQLILLSMLISIAAYAAPDQKPVFSILVPPDPVTTGQTVSVNLVALNSADYEIPYQTPKTMQAQLRGENGEAVIITLNLETNASREFIQPRRFLSHSYSFVVPEHIQGSSILTVTSGGSLRAVIDIQPAPQGQVVTDHTAPAAAPVAAPLDGLKPPPPATKLKRSFLDNFAPYEPIYFIYGPDAPAAKFQFSFQYRMLDNEGYIARNVPILKGLSFAYTQRSLWDIEAESSPFYDTSYMPEIFISSMAPATNSKRAFSWLGWQAGVGHESNGRSGDASRSMNKVSARAYVAFGDLDGWRLVLGPRVWAYIGDMSDNPDLNDYRGYMDLTASFGKNDSINLAVYARAGQNFEKGAVQVDLTYPIDALFKNFAGFLLVQYWNGYGESLLNYNKKTETIRAGISLVR